MAANFWLGGTSSNAETAANWSAGTVLADGEDGVFQATGTNGITGDLRAAEDIDPAAIRVIGNYRNNIGVSAADPFKLADVTTFEHDVDGGSTQVCYYDFTSATNAVIRRTGTHAESCYIVDGDYTNVLITSGNVIFGAGCTFGATAKIRIDREAGRPRPQVSFLAGAAMNAATQLWIGDAEVYCYTPLAGIVDIQEKGTLFHRPTTGTPTLALVNVNGGKLFIKATIAVICTRVEASGAALVDTTESALTVTFTDAQAHGDAVFDTRPGVDIYTNTPVVSGKGKIPNAALSQLSSY